MARQREERYERGAASASPPSLNALLLSSPPAGRDRSLSTGANSYLPPQSQTTLLPLFSPGQYVPVQDDQFPAIDEGHLGHPMTEAPSPFPVQGYYQPSPTTYMPQYTQNIAYNSLPALAVPYANPMNQSQFFADSSALATTTSCSSYMPITPTSLADGNSTNGGLICDNFYNPSYGSTQLHAPEAYTDNTNASVNPTYSFR
jgi:hypothetical protein